MPVNGMNKVNKAWEKIDKQLSDISLLSDIVGSITSINDEYNVEKLYDGECTRQEHPNSDQRKDYADDISEIADSFRKLEELWENLNEIQDMIEEIKSYR